MVGEGSSVSLFSLCLESDEQQRQQEKEEKKRYLLRKLSFRPSVDELKTRKVRYTSY